MVFIHEYSLSPDFTAECDFTPGMHNVVERLRTSRLAACSPSERGMHAACCFKQNYKERCFIRAF